MEVGAKVREFKAGDKVMCFGWNNDFAEYFKAKVWELRARALSGSKWIWSLWASRSRARCFPG